MRIPCLCKSQRALFAFALSFAMCALSAANLWAGGGVAINEVRIDQGGADNDEFFELRGSPGESLENFAYIVIGDGTGGSGVIESVTDLSGHALDANGFFVVAEGTFSIGVAGLTATLNFENSDNVTHLLVVLDPLATAPATGDDLDADDNGVLDVDEGGPAPWVGILDSVSLVENLDVPASGEFFYSPTVVGPDGTFVPGTAWRCGNGWVIGDFDLSLMTNTPGAENTCPSEDCTNGIDDDGDNAVDCADSDCFGELICIAPGPEGPRYGIEPIGTYATGVFDGSAAEIVAYDARSGSVFVTNSDAGSIDALSLAPSGALTLTGSLLTTGSPTHVRIWDDGVESFVVASVPNADGNLGGTVEVLTTAGVPVASYPVGVLPDMVFITSTDLAITANEGEPTGTGDPEGSVSIVDLTTGVVTPVSFTSFDGTEAALRAAGVRIFPGVSASVDLEPEYIAVSPDNSTAYAICQEQNAVAVIDIATATATAIVPLGTKDHSVMANAMDASDRDDTVNITTWPVRGMYMPDSAVAFEANGSVYLLTANEGDDRGENERVSSLTLDATAFPNAAELQLPENLGRLSVSSIDGDIDNDGEYEELYSYGARSFSIFDMTAGGALTYDSGSQLERVIEDREFFQFGSTNDENGSFDSRSDAKGPEPEAATIGTLNGRTLAFIGAERQGGIAIYDVTDPNAVRFHSYANNRDFGGDAEQGTAGDLGVEGLVFVPASDNPTGEPILIAANEVSGTTTVFRIVDLPVTELRIGSDFAPSGGEVELSVFLDTYLGDATAWSYGACHDPSILDLVSVADGSDLPGVPAGSTQFNQISVTPVGFTVAVVVCFEACVALTEGYDAELNVATYDVNGAVGVTTSVQFCETIGSPVVENVVSVGSLTFSPATLDGAVEITDPEPPFEFAVLDGAGTYSNSGLGTVATSVTLAQVDGGAPLATTGFSVAIGCEASQLTPVAVDPAGVLLTVAGGAPDFFQPTLLAGGITLGVIYDFSTTGGGLGETLEFTTVQPVFEVTFDLSGALAGSRATVTTPLTFPADLGSPVVENLVTIATSPGVNEVVTAAGVEGTITLSPGAPPFEFSVADATGGYSLSGDGSLTTRASIAQVDGGAVITTAGFSMAIECDPAYLAATGVTPVGALAALDSGNGPGFFEPSIVTSGFTLGVIYDFAPGGPGSGETLGFATGTEVIEVTYTVTATLGGSVVTTPLSFSDDLGSPTVENLVTDDTGTFAVAGVSGVVTLEPEAPPFLFTAADRTVSGSTFCTDLSIAQVAGTAIETAGFQMSIVHDPAVLSAQGASEAPLLAALNGGAGADFFTATVLANGITIGAIYSNDLSETIFYTSESTVVEACYDVLVASGSTATTSLDFAPNGMPLIENLVTSATTVHAAEGQSATIELVPEPEFIRSDCNSDGQLNIADGIFTLNFLFLGGSQGSCNAACDANSDGVIDTADAIFTFTYQFSDGAPPTAPFPSCGPSPSGESCNSNPGC